MVHAAVPTYELLPGKSQLLHNSVDGKLTMDCMLVAETSFSFFASEWLLLLKGALSRVAVEAVVYRTETYAEFLRTTNTKKIISNAAIYERS